MLTRILTLPREERPMNEPDRGCRHEAVCPRCLSAPYHGTHHGIDVYRCRNPDCEWYTAPLARTKSELRRVGEELYHIESIPSGQPRAGGGER